MSFLHSTSLPPSPFLHRYFVFLDVDSILLPGFTQASHICTVVDGWIWFHATDPACIGRERPLWNILLIFTPGAASLHAGAKCGTTLEVTDTSSLTGR